MDNRKQFVFSRVYWDEIRTLPKQDRLAVFEAISEHSLDGEINTVLHSKAATVFKRILPEIDKERRASVEGRNSVENKQWRKAVFERDDYTCRLCGLRGMKLNAHHIKPYAYYHDFRFDVNNGVTLCVSCHKLVHRLMRKGLL